MTVITLAAFIVIISIVLGFAVIVLWQIISGKINLEGLVSEPVDPTNLHGERKASLSRFQFLIFTFVIAGLYLLLCIEHGTFIDIPTNVLGLLGISGGSFVVSKAVGKTGGQTPAHAQSANQPAAPQPVAPQNTP